MQKEYPKWLSFAHEYTKDLPTHASKTATLVQKEGTKHYIHVNKLLSTFLSQQGVPQQYVQYASLGIIAVIGLVAAIITLSILSAILAALCGGKSREEKNRELRRKNDKKATEQHKQHERKLAAQQ